MPQALISLGYAGAFLVSFLSSTLVPLTAELALVPLLALGYSPWLLFGSSLAGSYSGALLSYAIGRSVSGLLLDRLLRISPEAQQKAKAVVQVLGRGALDRRVVVGGASRGHVLQLDVDGLAADLAHRGLLFHGVVPSRSGYVLVATRVLVEFVTSPVARGDAGVAAHTARRCDEDSRATEAEGKPAALRLQNEPYSTQEHAHCCQRVPRAPCTL